MSLFLAFVLLGVGLVSSVNSEESCSWLPAKTFSSPPNHLGQSIKKRPLKPVVNQKAVNQKALEMKTPQARALTHQSYVAFLVISHMTVSSTMLILNKAVLKRLPIATTVLLAQVGSSAVILWVLGKLKVLNVDPFQFSTVSNIGPIYL